MEAPQIEELKHKLKEFARRRDWEQFHSPKNLSTALMVEAAELAEHFQWLTQDQSENLDAKKLNEVRMEMADIFIYLLRLAERLSIDLYPAAIEKMQINEHRYPEERVRGSSRKYSEYK